MSVKKPQNYHLYGRKEYSRPLAQVCQFSLEDLESLQERALELAGDRWVELVAFPEAAIIRVIPLEEG